MNIFTLAKIRAGSKLYLPNGGYTILLVSANFYLGEYSNGFYTISSKKSLKGTYFIDAHDIENVFD